MLARLGNVIYWVGCAVAGIAVIGGAMLGYFIFTQPLPERPPIQWWEPVVYAAGIAVGATMMWDASRRLRRRLTKLGQRPSN